MPQVTCTGYFLKFGHVEVETCEGRDKQSHMQAYRHDDRNTLHPSRGRSNKCTG